MELSLKKWGNSLGLRIPHHLAQTWELDEHSIVELTETPDGLILRKKPVPLTLDDLLASIPPDFSPPDDLTVWTDSAPTGRELL
ncbi:MAG: AbrB/MazE/SpoVT family DNA-binding domain-containing protein [Oscillatoriales cyanobacterium]|nr:MAG: AbrB/MazE/SpoVT family DNA-binding domain-containing protein [Oscillatoriales cyanobacterium]